MYANIFDTHPLFGNVEWAKNLPFHGGCTYDQFITTEPTEQKYDWQKTYKTLKVGCDYAHYGDEGYEECHPRAGVPYSIQHDVSELLQALEESLEGA